MQLKLSSQLGLNFLDAHTLLSNEEHTELPDWRETIRQEVAAYIEDPKGVDPKGVAKLLDGLNVHKAPGPDGLNARVLKECSNEISPILALIFNESLARGDVPDEWRQAYVSRSLKKVKNMTLLITDRCRSHASAAKP